MDYKANFKNINSVNRMLVTDAYKIVLENMDTIEKISDELYTAVKIILESFEGNCYKHGMSQTKIYSVWTNMKNRCFDKSYIAYQEYGGRGITVYDEWINDFLAFYNYVSKLPHFGETGYSLDRIDVNGNYKSGNIRWATHKEQMRNRRCSISVEYNGKIFTLKEIAEILGTNYKTIYYRYVNGRRGAKLFEAVKKDKI